ncbi:TorF family putative porin [Sphingomonas quercus]|uniref:TorF family putative porin n=1 Tax=Sphingomonas quercus TaxID=2842451 RepID=A0ABS6BL11_9SPHN|nr:TorF family putative porin [Sphingomonas quercus]MBU3078111.1 TorF family putative porin [Sphingomonas quercus]
MPASPLPTAPFDPPARARRQLWHAAAVLILQHPLTGAAPAQLGGGIGVESDYRLRGYSLSAGRPVATGQLGYDHSSGLYVDGYAVAMFAQGRAHFLGWDTNIGYARRLGTGAAADLGVIRRQYRASYAGGRASRYTELYAGLTLQPIVVRLYYSPDSFVRDASTLYGEVEGTLIPSRDWRIGGHVGALAFVDDGGGRPVRYDWRLSATRLLGSFDVHAALSGGRPGRQYYDGRAHDRTALTAGASWNF